MSGHSKWSTIKHQKGINDAARGKLFSKLSKAITVATKTGGGGNPDVNNRLRIAIENARASNMPSENIKRAISRAEKEASSLQEVVYEGFGPEGISVIILAATDNKNRTVQELKSLFDRNNGSLGGPGSVSFNFDYVGEIIVKKEGADDQLLRLIDLGVEDINEENDNLNCFVEPKDLYEIAGKIQNMGGEVISSKLIYKPKITQKIIDETKIAKIDHFLETLYDLEDVQDIFTNAEI